MSDANLILREYEISKENIRGVMSHMITISGSVVTASVIVFRLAFGGGENDTSYVIPLVMMTIVLINLVIGFVCYQNVQIIALQRHIQLETRINLAV